MRISFIRFSFAAVLAATATSAIGDSIRQPAQRASEQVWTLEADGVFVEHAGKGRQAVPLPDWQSVREPYGFPPQIAFGPDGEVVVTSNVLPVVWTIDPVSLAVSTHRLQLSSDEDKDFGFSGLVYSERNRAYIAISEPQGAVWKIDRALSRAEKMGAAR